jgi:hypothetical protein
MRTIAPKTTSDVCQPISLALIDENAMFFNSNDKREAFPT